MASLTGTLYIGMTNNLINRTYQHKKGLVEGFSKKYSCNKLIYYEVYQDVQSAIAREKEVKKWRREKKQELIKAYNPHWKDLYQEVWNRYFDENKENNN
jgi:putative endonuclease